MLSFLHNNIILIINIFYYIFGFSSLIVYYFFYEHDNQLVKKSFNHILLFHISLYVNIPIMTSLSCIKNHLFLVAWLVVLNMVHYILSFLTFIFNLYRDDCPTYMYLLVYLHISTVVFIGLCIRYKYKKEDKLDMYVSV